MSLKAKNTSMFVEDDFWADEEGLAFRGRRVPFDQIGSIYYRADRQGTIFWKGSEISILKFFDLEWALFGNLENFLDILVKTSE